MTFIIHGGDMAFLVYALCAALVLAFMLAVYELEQLTKPKKKRGPWDKK